MTDCVFCKIIDKQIPAEILFEDEDVLAFPDINAQAPHHLLIIPKKHIAALREATNEDQAILGKLLLTANHLAEKLNFKDSGYRTIINCGDDGGQTVYHIHVHVLAGRRLTWPPG